MSFREKRYDAHGGMGDSAQKHVLLIQLTRSSAHPAGGKQIIRNLGFSWHFVPVPLRYKPGNHFFNSISLMVEVMALCFACYCDYPTAPSNLQYNTIPASIFCLRCGGGGLWGLELCKSISFQKYVQCYTNFRILYNRCIIENIRFIIDSILPIVLGLWAVGSESCKAKTSVTIQKLQTSSLQLLWVVLRFLPYFHHNGMITLSRLCTSQVTPSLGHSS